MWLYFLFARSKSGVRRLIGHLMLRFVGQSELGFAMYQTVEENSSPTFHSVLDIVCRNCQQKVATYKMWLVLANTMWLVLANTMWLDLANTGTIWLV